MSFQWLKLYDACVKFYLKPSVSLDNCCEHWHKLQRHITNAGEQKQSTTIYRFISETIQDSHSY